MRSIPQIPYFKLRGSNRTKRLRKKRAKHHAQVWPIIQAFCNAKAKRLEMLILYGDGQGSYQLPTVHDFKGVTD